MPPLGSFVGSSIGKKFLMGLTGLLLVGFVVMHLLGNILLFNDNPDPFNKYSHTLINLGALLYVVEAGLVLFFIIHIFTGVSVWRTNKKARPERYKVLKSAGYPSRQNVSSRSMIYTGGVLGVFIVLHIITFKYGPYYTTMVDGVEMRDLYRLVQEVFQSPLYVGWYVFAMIFLGFHLRHGFWSAFQSLAFYHPKYTPIIYGIGYTLAVVLATGYVAIPVWIFLK